MKMVSTPTAQDTWDTLLCEVDEYGDRYWFDENVHLHRENGPAVIYVDGAQYWYRHGKCHRDDGPAIMCPNGEVHYRIDGEPLSEEEFTARKLTING